MIYTDLLVIWTFIHKLIILIILQLIHAEKYAEHTFTNNNSTWTYYNEMWVNTLWGIS